MDLQEMRLRSPASAAVLTHGGHVGLVTDVCKAHRNKSFPIFHFIPRPPRLVLARALRAAANGSVAGLSGRRTQRPSDYGESRWRSQGGGSCDCLTRGCLVNASDGLALAPLACPRCLQLAMGFPWHLEDTSVAGPLSLYYRPLSCYKELLPFDRRPQSF